MPDVLIAAITRISDAAELENSLSQCAGLDTSRINIFTKENVGRAPDRARIHFIPFRGSPVSWGSHGTNVPGMGSRLALSPYFGDGHEADHLKDSGITYDAAQYYNVAIEQGRSVVTSVSSKENATLTEEQFRACGFMKIRRFALSEEHLVAKAALL